MISLSGYMILLVSLERSKLLSSLYSFLFVFVFLLPNILVNSSGHVGTVSSPNNTFFLDQLEQAVNQYFMNILLLVTDNKPS